MTPLSTSDRIAISAFLLLLVFQGLWLINDAFSVAYNFHDGIVGNGFWWMSETQAFHVGLYMIMLPVFGLFLMALHSLMPRRGESG